MSIVLVANSLDDLTASSGMYHVTNPTGYDSAYVSQGLANTVSGGFLQIDLNKVPNYEMGNEIWFHFRSTRYQSGNSYYSSSECMFFYDRAGANFLEGGGGNGASGIRFRQFGTAWQGYTPHLAPTLTTGVGNTWDFQFVVDGTTQYINIYLNGILNVSLEGPQGTKTLVDRLNFYTQHFPAIIAGGVAISEIIVSKTSTLGMRLLHRKVYSEGDLTGFAGDVMSLNDAGANTGLVTNAPDQRHTWFGEPYTGPAHDLKLICMASNAHRIEGNNPSRIGSSLRMNDINLDKPTKGVGHGLTRIIDTWDVNPVTGLPWHTSDLDSLQYGIKSAI